MYIVGQGAVTAVGHDAGRTVASLRSGLDGFVELPFAGVSGNDLRAVPVRGFGQGLAGSARYECLAIAALRQCIELLLAHEPKRPVIFLGLPRADRPGVPDGLAATVGARLEHEFKLPRGSVRPIQEGRVSAFMGLQHAQTTLQGGAGACIVGGVDCLVNPHSLTGLSEQGRVVEEYDGFFPGEGASFLCLSDRGDRGIWGRRAARIASISTATEAADGTAEHPLLGNAIREVFRNATAGAQVAEAELGVYINSVNGTRSEFEDDAIAQTKFFRSPREFLEIWHIASFLGETGAAYGAVSLMLAAAAAELGFGQRKATIVSATEGAWRSAACVIAGRDSPPAPGAVSLSSTVPQPHRAVTCGVSIPAEDDPGIRLSEEDLHGELVVRNLEEVAGLLLIRDGHLQNDSPWADIEGFEQRMLAHYDAVGWHGDAVAAAITLFGEDGEPENAAAAAMALCGAAWATSEHIDWLVGLCSESEDHLRMIVDVAAFMPQAVARKLLLKVVDVDESHEAAALRGLSAAGWIDATFAKNRAPGVTPGARASLIVAIGAAQLQGLEREVDGLLRAPDKLRDPLAWLAALAVLPAAHVQSLLGTEDGLEFAPHALAASCVKSGQSLFNAVQSRPLTPGLVTALGYSGETEATDLLLEALASEDGELATEAAQALNRIFGCDLFEEVVVEDEDNAEDEDEETVEVLIQEAGRWREAIEPVLSTEAKRLRHGRALVAESALGDLLLERPCHAERAISVLEYSALSGKPAPLHPRQLVALQRERLP